MLEQATAEAITKTLERDGCSSDSVQQLKQRFPMVHFTLCSDDDILNARPVVERPGFNLYLVNSQEHCLTLTNDFASASGVVIATIEEE